MLCSVCATRCGSEAGALTLVQIRHKTPGATFPAVSRSARPRPPGPASLASRRGGSKWVGMERKHTFLTEWVCVSQWGYVRGPDQRPSAHPSGEEGGGGLQEAFRGGEGRGSGRGSTLVFQVYVCFNFPHPSFPGFSFGSSNS